VESKERTFIKENKTIGMLDCFFGSPLLYGLF